MTYQEIISQVARRLGHTGFDSQLKADYQYAVHWAEQELMVDAEPARRTATFNIKSTQAEYAFKNELFVEDFSRPCELQFYDDEGNQLAYEEVTYDEWLRWNPTSAAEGTANDVVGGFTTDTPAIQDTARLSNRVVWCIHFVAGEGGDDSDHWLSVKPAIDAEVVMNYTVTDIMDIWDDLDESPRVPEVFHHFIIPGAVYYLAQVESAQALTAGDTAKSEFYTRAQGIAFAEFERRKNKVAEKTGVTTKAVVARPFMWYDDPTKYR